MPTEIANQARATLNRNVWVENILPNDYVEMYRGKVIVVPGRGKVKMGFMEASRFVSQFKDPLEKDVSGNWVPAKAVGPKGLRLVEMTDDERTKHDGISPEDRQKAEQDMSKEVGLTCMKCGFRAVSEKGLKIHASTIHPGETAEE